MKSSILCLSVALAFGLTFIEFSGSPLLGSERADLIVGQDVLNDRICNVGSADCNFANGTFPNCPPANGFCSYCDPNNTWDTCVVNQGTTCDDGYQNGCGKLRIGNCPSGATTCQNGVWYGPSCSTSVPSCR